jgi:anti-sigma B factor antagonist
MEFGFKISDKNKYALLQLTGNLMEKSEAREMIEDIGSRLKEQPNFVIDLSEFTYMNSSGLNVLLNILTAARRAGGEAVICSVPEKIKSLMVTTKLIHIFSVADSESGAIKLLAG